MTTACAWRDPELGDRELLLGARSWTGSSHAEARRARSRMDVERARWWFARMRAVIDGKEGAR